MKNTKRKNKIKRIFNFGVEEIEWITVNTPWHPLGYQSRNFGRIYPSNLIGTWLSGTCK